MNRAARCGVLTLACVGLALASASDHQVRAATPLCAPQVLAFTRLAGRVDSLVALDSSGATAALVGPSSSALQYLPHDNLALLATSGMATTSITLPPYITPPGLAASGPDATTLYAVVDNAVLLVDPHSGTVRARIRLDLQALGWPAAVVAAPGNRLYVVGQPAHGWAAVVEALQLGPTGRARVLWRAQLGLFHAGIWLGRAQSGHLAVYMPGTYDVAGSVSLLDERRGALQAAYHVPASPVAADPVGNRLYVEVAGTLRALTLDGGRAVASVRGGALALAPARGLIAFVQGNGIAVANARTLRPLAHIALPGVTALAATPDGATLLAGLRHGISRVDLAGCRAA